MAEQTILLAEDDDMIRSFVCSVLQGHGYSVLSAENGTEALRLAKRVGVSQIDLLLTDVEMPMLNGIRLVRCLKQLRPDMKVLFMTGHRGAYEDEIWDQGMVIEKPFGYSVLVRAVYTCLLEEMSVPS